MDVIFDIDGTLANAEHRLHFIKDTGQEDWTKDWDSFLSDEQVAKDTPIPETWNILTHLILSGHHKIIYVTGRSEKQRFTTFNWLTQEGCTIRKPVTDYYQMVPGAKPIIYMRKDGDHRPSHIVKEEALMRIRAAKGDPKIAFEDRAEDTAMWRRNGLLCCQVAKGNY